MYMVMAVLVPIGVLIIAVVIVFFVFRHLQKQRPESQENLRVREELLPQEYGGIRVTQVGDSTLQVRGTELAVGPNIFEEILSISCSAALDQMQQHFMPYWKGEQLKFKLDLKIEIYPCAKVKYLTASL